MKRTAGVIASGVVGIIGSLFTFLVAIALAATLIAVRSNPSLAAAGPTPPPVEMTAVLATESVILFGLGIFGVVSAIGLLRLKNWARVSFLVFGGLLGGVSVMAMLGTLMAAVLMPQMMPPGQQVPPGFVTGILLGFSAFWLAMVGLSVWWLIYFTRLRVKEQFMSAA